jgi:hypothetical protein
MTEPTRASAVECLRCGKQFEPRKQGHVFCSTACRHRGERKPHERVPVDQAAVARLFDSSRYPDERVRADEWFLGPPEFAALYAYDTVRQRRRWYRNLVAEGLIEGPAPR